MARSASQHPEVVAAANGNGHSSGFRHGKLLVAVAIATGLLLTGIIIGRAVLAQQRDRALCEKIDRFIATVEMGVSTSPTLTPSEKAARIRFYENFRNDPPVCRTAPAPAAGGP